MLELERLAMIDSKTFDRVFHHAAVVYQFCMFTWRQRYLRSKNVAFLRNHRDRIKQKPEGVKRLKERHKQERIRWDRGGQ